LNVKKAIGFVVGIVAALFLAGCPNDDTPEDTPVEQNGRTLKISNQSGGYIYNVRWDVQEFCEEASPPSYMPSLDGVDPGKPPESIPYSDATGNPLGMIPWPEGYRGRGLNKGGSAIQPVDVSETSSYVYFNFVKNLPEGFFPPIVVFSVRTKELVVVSDDPVVFTINDNTIVVSTESFKSYQGPLSGLVSGGEKEEDAAKN
jgi:hypothetical protein